MITLTNWVLGSDSEEDYGITYVEDDGRSGDMLLNNWLYMEGYYLSIAIIIRENERFSIFCLVQQI